MRKTVRSGVTSTVLEKTTYHLSQLTRALASLAGLIGSMEDIGTNFLLKFWQPVCHLFPFIEMARGLQEEIWEK
jgi:hypothetical protein